MVRLFICLVLASVALAAPAAQCGCRAPVTQSRPIASNNEYEEMRRAAQLASAAYLDCRPMAYQTNIDHMINNNSTDTQGYIGHDDDRKRIIVSMRGTTNVIDSLNDLDVGAVCNPQLSGVKFPKGVKLHKGVLEAWRSVHDEVIQKVGELHEQHPDYTIESVGHSLGGSLTYLNHVALAQNFPKVKVVSNAIAAFPIGNDVWSIWADSQGTMRRINNQGDGVPNMWNNKYVHYGTEYYGPGTPEDTRVCDGNLDMKCVAGDGYGFVDLAHVSSSGVVMIVSGCGSPDS